MMSRANTDAADMHAAAAGTARLAASAESSLHAWAARALEWAMKEAAIRRAPLTVIAVHQAIVGHYGGTANDPQDPERTEKARASAQAETGEVLAELPGPHPVSVTVRAAHGFPEQELIRASQ